MKKKLLLSLLATTLATTSLVGCGGGDKPASTPAGDAQATTEASASPEGEIGRAHV